RFVRFQQYATERIDGFLIVRECHSDPLLGDRARSEIGVPGQTAKSVPVGLGEMMAAPVAVRAGVGYAGDSRQSLFVKTAVYDFRHCRSGTFGVSVRVEELAPH